MIPMRLVRVLETELGKKSSSRSQEMGDLQDWQSNQQWLVPVMSDEDRIKWLHWEGATEAPCFLAAQFCRSSLERD